jgi:Tol biopolymer transport system component
MWGKVVDPDIKQRDAGSDQTHQAPQQRVRDRANEDYNNVYAVGPDGRGPRLIVNSGGEPAWSPDGRRIASNVAGAILITDARGKHRRFVGGGTNPRWSPDGKRIAFELEKAPQQGSQPSNRSQGGGPSPAAPTSGALSPHDARVGARA